MPSELLNNLKWWNGPSCLPTHNWPTYSDITNKLVTHEEERKITLTAHVLLDSLDNLLNPKNRRVHAQILAFEKSLENIFRPYCSL